MLQRQPLRAGCAAAFALHVPDLAADHQGRQRAGAFRLRVAMGDDLAMPQDRGAVAQALHLFEPVRNVEQRLAFAFQPVERLEQKLRLLRRQNGGRFVQNDELGVLQQATRDFDALALACR